MAADQRVTTAREFLEGARKRKVSELPPSVLMREDAELRRQLGQVLNILDGAAGVLGKALTDAADYREGRAGDGYCADCEASPADLCEQHTNDLDLHDAYVALAAELGIELDR